MNDKQKAIAWAVYVLPIFEAKYPEDNRPRKAIVAAKNKTDYAAAAASYAAADAAADASAASYAAASYAAADAAADAADASAASYAASAASYAASYAASAASYAASAASAAAYAADAAGAADAAADAIIRSRHGEDKLLIAKVNLLWSLEEQLEIANKIEWLEHKPTEVWQVLLKERW